jgi:hypothetical protein
LPPVARNFLTYLMTTAMVVSKQLTDAYRALQREADGYVLLIQVGSSMQVMDEGARRVSAITGLKLQPVGAGVPALGDLGRWQSAGKPAPTQTL